MSVDPTRSRTMRAVKSRDTKPEMIVRRLVHALGYRYRLHRSDLPGKPDLAFGPRRKVIFVHGCFWHGHHCKRGARVPKTNTAYWVAKIDRNRTRDAESAAALTQRGWAVLAVWECEIKDREALAIRLHEFLISS
ncbi:MAG: DNA mismatch endonuclease Vsr [Rhodospirillaceae bacterium]|jgi:DNA mismatch endonuclease (patch repair protein)|nr:DNA mismatch endonuclease Vsr [Rhodospirillaceae bacterium]MBT5666463.1 DNA mismatch endonuclease Vsr [Rhodospirillaceae bacterium]MBT5810015.1 DNA mismatch endonuclease Vsr [Rhodospirillaceae bacterium]